MTISAKPPVYDLSVETIYLDSLFALNAIIDYLLLLCSARAAGAVLHRWRLALAAVLGGLWAVACVLPGLGFLSYAPMKLVPALFMVLIAFGGERRLWRCVVIFLAVSAAFGGAVWAASMLAGSGFYGRRLYISPSAGEACCSGRSGTQATAFATPYPAAPSPLRNSMRSGRCCPASKAREKTPLPFVKRYVNSLAWRGGYRSCRIPHSGQDMACLLRCGPMPSAYRARLRTSS